MRLSLLDEESVKIKLTITHKESKTQVYETESAVYYKTAKMGFNNVSIAIQ